MNYGYIRVSSKDQNIDRQLKAIREVITDDRNIYTDRQSGKDFDRPAYKKLIKKLKQGDVLYVKSIDRLGRNYDEILEQWRLITKVKQADICVIEFPMLDTRKKEDGDLTGAFIADLVLQILSYVAQTERDFIRQRQAEGIEAARLRGQKIGRSAAELPENFREIMKRYNSGEIKSDDAAVLCGFSRSTFYKYLHIYNGEQE